MARHIALIGLFLAALVEAQAQSLPQTPGPKNAITDVPGIEVGNHTAQNGSGGMTGTTVILARGGATAGVAQRGGAPGTRLTGLLKPEKAIDIVHAVTLSGGSAYGLAASDGVTSCLESQGIGTPIGNGAVVPVVPGAIPSIRGAVRHSPSGPMLRSAWPHAAQPTAARSRWGTWAPVRVHARAGQRAAWARPARYSRTAS